MTTDWIPLAILNRLDSSQAGLQPTNLYNTIGKGYREMHQIDRALIDLFNSGSIATKTGKLPPYSESNNYAEWQTALFKITEKGSGTLKKYKFE